MFLLDTNVVSELRKPPSRVDASVAAWVASVDPQLMYLSAVTLFELELGLRRIEWRDPRQGERVRRWMDESVLAAFADRILPVDRVVALQAAAFHVPDPRPTRDSVIAATAMVARMTVVTRNVRDFAAMKVALLDPWTMRSNSS